MKLTRQEIVVIRNALAHEIEAHQAGYSVAEITKNGRMVEFHSATIDAARSADEKLSEMDRKEARR